MAGYPAEPWQLRGQAYASVFLVPLSDVRAEPPPGCRAVRFGRFGVVGVAWVSYEPGGVLAYSELMATLLVRRGWRLMPTITQIWVDSESSRDGGQALWGIPKRLARFEVDGGRFTAADAHDPIAATMVGSAVWLPGRWPVRFRVAQWLGGAAKLSPVRARGRVGTCRARLDPDPGGALTFLAGRRPLVSFSLQDFRMRFGGR